ncbi:MAG: oligosaccharide flippase family protein [Acidobacteria bacterium]|jgi:O-antigen/teichoic acid export membrane protein|nr:oligosaccharide flippase family protein [Acidobacteriota bacterium]
MDNELKTENSRSIARNVLYGFSTFIIPLFFSFYATRLIVKKLGNEDYGLYALVLGFVVYSFNFSFGRAITKYIAEYRISGENHKINDVISAALSINLAVALTGVALICWFANWLVTNVYLIEPENQAKTTTGLHIASAIVFFLMLNQIFSAILQGIHRFDIFSKISNLNNLAVVLGNIFLVYNDYNFLDLLFWNLIITFFTGFVFVFYAKKFVPEFKISFTIKPEILKLIVRFSSGIIGYQILANLLLLFERGWIISKLGAENLTFYVVPMTLSIFIHNFIGSFALVIFPLASELKDNPEKLLRLYKKATKIVCFLVVFLATTLIVESHLFLTLWMGADFAAQTSTLLVIHTISFSLLAIQTISWQMTEGLGYPGYNIVSFIICLVINVFLIVLLTQSLGNVGVAFGRMAGLSAMFLSIFYIEKLFFDRIQTKFWLKLLGVIGVAAFSTVITEKLIVSNFQTTWSVFVFATISGGIVYCAALLVLGFVDAEDKLLIKNLIRR